MGLIETACRETCERGIDLSRGIQFEIARAGVGISPHVHGELDYRTVADQIDDTAAKREFAVLRVAQLELKHLRVERE